MQISRPAFRDLATLWHQLSARTRSRFPLLLLLVAVLSGLAELASIGLFIPFLTLLTSDADVVLPWLRPIRDRLGLDTQIEAVMAAGATLAIVIVAANALLFVQGRLHRRGQCRLVADWHQSPEFVC